MSVRRLVLLATLLWAPSCSEPASAPAPVGAEWLRGDVDGRFATVAKHLRGLDVAMVEVGHRYGELYWAGRDRNWPYATYQIDKIELAMANAVERRPKRADSARMLDGAIAHVRAAVAAADAAAFDAAFTTLTATCNACHDAERVPFMPVAPPAARLSVIRAAPPAQPPAAGSSP